MFLRDGWKVAVITASQLIIRTRSLWKCLGESSQIDIGVSLLGGHFQPWTALWVGFARLKRSVIQFNATAYLLLIWQPSHVEINRCCVIWSLRWCLTSMAVGGASRQLNECTSARNARGKPFGGLHRRPCDRLLYERDSDCPRMAAADNHRVLWWSHHVFNVLC